ncbi:DUF1127 domain-containing protein [Qingshengfaniella alkalisoli]|uniref:DUF1127 domain-containing protein n=1 Tax=Qingshengfaniella alkalisoli TaxID=2599296 RepID=A0A5B8I8A5_9RHOB|nr:DUF1127 domain-containing protein [Qingshengfaniella alkalisoli]QDY69959.1 DUF1127 domain-containing protein [Qingshengfaniella alkalisoli]
MAYANDIRVQENGFLGAIRGFFARVAEVRERQARYFVTLHELEQLSDRELADLGISRFDIRNIAKEAAAK